MQLIMPFNKFNTSLQFDNLEGMLTDKGYDYICGVDEVGRGPLAGPVVAAAVILPVDCPIEGLDDSKKLSPARRDELFAEIVRLDIPCAVGIIDPECIDRINIHKASQRAMRKAVIDLNPAADFVLVDGKFLIPNLNLPQMAIVGGDAKHKAISAASIVAKVTRDRIMMKYDEMYDFSFAAHKGYPTKAHIEELHQHGPSDIHRRSFKPVADLLVDDYVLL